MIPVSTGTYLLAPSITSHRVWKVREDIPVSWIAFCTSSSSNVLFRTRTQNSASCTVTRRLPLKSARVTLVRRRGSADALQLQPSLLLRQSPALASTWLTAFADVEDRILISNICQPNTRYENPNLFQGIPSHKNHSRMRPQYPATPSCLLSRRLPCSSLSTPNKKRSTSRCMTFSSFAAPSKESTWPLLPLP